MNQLNDQNLAQLREFIAEKPYHSVRLFFDQHGNVTFIDGVERINQKENVNSLLAEEEYQELTIKVRKGKTRFIERRIKRKIG
ncbi:MAG: hypothetical protein AB8B61_04515 [Cyclobacteriaceae bacterium]